jgi:hypothetical protein
MGSAVLDALTIVKELVLVKCSMQIMRPPKKGQNDGVTRQKRLLPAHVPGVERVRRGQTFSEDFLRDFIGAMV